MALLPVAEALARILDGAGPAAPERAGLLEAAGRVLAEDLPARLTQPPFAASAMDGYAVRAGDVARLPARLKVIGEAAAGAGFRARLGPGEAVRIFTGAPLPEGADAVVIQENTAREGDRVVVTAGAPDPAHVRPRGLDFGVGEVLLRAGRRIDARALTLAAAMGYAEIPVRPRPRVAILATGDELVPPGTAPGADQIVASNAYGIAAMVAHAGGEPRLLGIARDTHEALASKIAAAAGADVLVTIGGASVGDHDLVAAELRAAGMALEFWKIAMRPGKPLLYGRLGPQRVLGVPGNPVSALVCARVFLVPLVRRLLGIEAEGGERAARALAANALEANGPRTHYMRAKLSAAPANGLPRVAALALQDSSLLAPLAEADCLIVRPPLAPPVAAGSEVDILLIDF
jgi:molybdopterin molybdotransferase